MNRVADVSKLPIRAMRIGRTAEPPLVERGIRRLPDAREYESVATSLSAPPFRAC